MVCKSSNLNINLAASAATPVGVPTFGLLVLATATVSTVGFARRINGTLNDGRSRLGLNLGQDFCDGLLRYRSWRNGHRGGGGHLHETLPARSSYQSRRILSGFYQKIINHFMVQWALDKLLIFNHFGLVKGNEKRLSQCMKANAI